ncbi:MAG TPA: hypothetical protein VK473_08535 [Terriglobales bacterium]|nr:hypothetical protein [Terriglobales bacterium]
MSIDSGGPSPKPKPIDLWRLPEILELRVRRRHFEPAFRVTTEGKDRLVRDAVEVEIRVTEPFPIRGLGPVLWIGDEPLTIAESDGKKTYRFLAFKPNALRADAPISLSWNSPGARRTETRFRFAVPSE